MLESTIRQMYIKYQYTVSLLTLATMVGILYYYSTQHFSSFCGNGRQICKSEVSVV